MPANVPRKKQAAAAPNPQKAAKKQPEALAPYRAKRNFKLTEEPQGQGADPSPIGSQFVIQKHAARRLHYDLRLEINGVLKSWALPKGVPTAPGERRLAVEVEDHPIEYGGFEGTIPKGQYGGGTVMLWDKGIFSTASASAPDKDWRSGKLHIHLEGSKLRGEWTLVRLREPHQWLIIRNGPRLPMHPDWERSVLSGRTLSQITEADTATSGRPRAHFIEPMKARLVHEAPEGPDWTYEIKFDGYRLLAVKNQDEVCLYSRNKKDFTPRFPRIAEAVRMLDTPSVVLDGELIAFTPDGRPSFQALQDAGPATDIQAFFFDLLLQDGDDLKPLPLMERRERLKKLLPPTAELLRYSAALKGTASQILKGIVAKGLEGIIAKKLDSIYEPGARSATWQKIKCLHQQEFVIGGLTPPKGSRKHFGALLVGFQSPGKGLQFAGKVGTGFNTRSLATLHQQLESLQQPEPPFVDLPRKSKSNRFGHPLTAAEMKQCTWVNPTLVCQVKFAEWTADDLLRQPVFLGLREDKSATEVVREA